MCLQNLVVDIWLVYMVYLAKECFICNSKTADVNQVFDSQNTVCSEIFAVLNFRGRNT